MKASETTFQKLVEGSKQFQVPLYQRPYSWGKEELERLWDDLTEQTATDLAAEETGRPGWRSGPCLCGRPRWVPSRTPGCWRNRLGSA
ncbi:DUF262 domain-containing protein [Nocardiopsis algeriensis]|uniref:GmrSD restriction endonucleases N-terminal domain-containing protein n=1 Tax=Nocardiopsis algeriensis TaxID=1478215 RepID=A0A841IQV6_9ACTN|nr:DUF262 domain-containing protein [Nocardiopsis algeriensis]MBB6120594.1 hypothetical protein [Nocardiopsis algeriensis]